MPDEVLTRILEAFAEELIDASDQEIMQAANDLGMNPRMRGSAAFQGLTFPATLQLADFFDVEVVRQHIARDVGGRLTGQMSTSPRAKSRRSKRPEIPADTENSGKK